MKEWWDTHIARAEELTSRNHEARELLEFYAQLLRAQKDIYEFLRGCKGWLPSGSLEQDLSFFRVAMPRLLNVVKSRGSEALAGEAHNLLHASQEEMDKMLIEYWRVPTDLQFFAKAFLQPFARWLAETGAKPVDRNLEGGENRCPFCAGKPQLTFLQSAGQASESGGRYMICATCFTVWPFRRVVCADCREERPAKLAYYQSPEYDHIRVEACDTCGYYIKGVDLTRLGLAIPLVDEVAAAPLDLWAIEHGYTKIELNLIGL
ncbi:MAG: formate dehydrogenase accessory protein FdhE [Acidobacteria bacterium]|nr:formate dehydrogenase accessory protein FdhE [Acidobacteriota bacterium]